MIHGYIGIGGREVALMHNGGGLDRIQGIIINEVIPGGSAAQTEYLGGRYDPEQQP